MGPGVVAFICNLNYLGGRNWEDKGVQLISLGEEISGNPISASWAWWCMSEMPATW
jgi:hypothetical protein